MEVSSNLSTDNLIQEMVSYGTVHSNPGEEAIMKKERLLMVLGVAFMATLLIASSLVITPAKSVFAAEKKVIKIGAIISKTGFASGSETLIWNGLQLFEGWINKKGGLKIKGVSYAVQFVAEDGQSSADGAVAAATKLVNDDRVKFIIGPVMPFMVVASGSVTEPAKVLRVVLYNCFTPDEYGPKTPYTFIANDTTIDFTTPDMQFLKKKFPKAKNIAVLTPDDGAQTSLNPYSRKRPQRKDSIPCPS